MRCPWCHNAYLIPYEFGKNATIIHEEDFFNFLDQRKSFLDGVVITGGEPTLQPDLPDFCKNVKKLGFSVKLDTNGTDPEMLDLLIKGNLVDYIAMDVKSDLHQYQRLFREKVKANVITESIEVVMSSAKLYEFRTTCVDPYVTMNNIDEIGSLIHQASKHYLQKCSKVKPFNVHKEYKIVNESEMINLKNKLEKYVFHCEIR